jgi:hypothetical protein
MRLNELKKYRIEGGTYAHPKIKGLDLLFFPKLEDPRVLMPGNPSQNMNLPIESTQIFLPTLSTTGRTSGGSYGYLIPIPQRKKPQFFYFIQKIDGSQTIEKESDSHRPSLARGELIFNTSYELWYGGKEESNDYFIDRLEGESLERATKRTLETFFKNHGK